MDRGDALKIALSLTNHLPRCDDMIQTAMNLALAIEEFACADADTASAIATNIVGQHLDEWATKNTAK